MQVLGEAQQAAWRARTLPPVERLAGGLVSVPVPIPDNPLRYTLTYLVPGDHGLVVVDPGWNSDPGWSALISGLALAGAAPADVTGIVITHVHPDHHGLTARLRRASGAWVAMHPAERESLRRDDPRPHETMARWLRGFHVPDAEIADLMAAFGDDVSRHMAPLADADVLLEDGDPVPMAGRRLRAIWTPGHTPGHLCLLEPDAGLLLTGDHLLPRITPNIGLQFDGDGRTLERYLDSLARLAAYDEHAALPAHEYRFRGIAERAAEITEHHRERCAEIVATVDRLGAPTVWELASALSWSRPWSQIGAMKVGAVAETAAHVDLLVADGRLIRKKEALLTN
ncbi:MULTISPECIES: MBL fold metallo-hydrolase [Actinoplanes]|uniref:MBL fold metallo-hydrolase n=1 Tax=Actinoplanes TaxID=1865 RepID=UPI0005F2F0AB|nr:MULTISPECIES: MBL fold metallo-hydrolase [Actinoplanes]GLX99705.1 MBL fold metallo-hydrolase [Actinoplanes sp. NBRC 101535]